MDQKTVMNRLGRGGCVVAALALALPASGQEAYFSFQGDFNTLADQHDFNFGLSRTVFNTENVQFITFARNGGVNAAGDTIAADLTAIDSVLELTDSTLFLHGFNDDASGLDSRIGWTQPSGIPLNPNPLPIEAYRLNMIEFGNNATGAWAVDLVAPADAITLTGSTPTGTSTTSSLKFGTNSPTGSAATFNQSATLTISDNLTIAQTGQAVFNNSGTTTVLGSTDLNTGGTLTQTAGILFTDTFNLNGGTLDIQGGVWSVNQLTGLTTLDVNGFMNIGDVTAGTSAASLAVGSGQSLDVQGTFSVGEFGKAGTLTINNGGIVTAQTNARIGGFGGTNGSSISVTGGNGGVDSLFDVNGDLRVGGSFAGPGGTGTLTVGGTNGYADATVDGNLTIFTGSTVSVFSNGILNVAGSSNVTGTVNVAGGVFVTGGTLDIQPGGSINVNSFGGSIFADTLAISGGTFSNPGGGVLEINRMQNFGSLNLSYLLQIGQVAAGNSTSSVIVGNGENIGLGQFINIGINKPGHLTINNGGQVTAGTKAQIGNLAGSAGSTVTVNTGGLFDLAGALVVGGESYSIQPSTLTIDGAGAETEVDGTTTLRAGSTISILNGGLFDANGNVNIDGGMLTADNAANFNLAAGKTLTASNAGQIDFTAGFNSYNIDEGTTFNINTGADFLLNSLRVGDGSAGTLIVDGAGSTLGSVGGVWGDNGGFATGTIRNGANASGGSNTILRNGSLTVDGAGSTVTQGSSGLLSVGSNSGGVFDLNVRNGGAFTTGQDYTEVIKDGTINVESGATFTVKGQFRIYEDGEVNVAGGTLIANQPTTLLNNSTLNLSSGTLNAPAIDHTHGGAFNFTGGTLHVGTFDGTLDQQGGTLAPGSSPGKTVITGDYGLTAGTLEIELGGTTAGVDFDQVEVLGVAQLFGDLDVSLINGFVPTYGDSFDFLFAWGGTTDAFSTISLPAVPIPNAAWSLINDGNMLFLNLDSTLVGDLNNDGFVGIGDLNIVLGAWNQNVPPGDPLADPSGDGFVGIDDLNAVLGNWNAGTPPGGSASIPEPGTAALLGAVGLMALRRAHAGV